MQRRFRRSGNNDQPTISGLLVIPCNQDQVIYPYGVMVARQSPKLLVWVQILVRVPKCRYSTMEVHDVANVEMRVQFSLLAPISQGGCWFPNKAHNLVYVSSILTPATNIAERHGCYEGFINLSVRVRLPTLQPICGS